MVRFNYDDIMNAIATQTALIQAQGGNTEKRLEAIEEHLAKLNGTVRQNCLDIALLADHDKDQRDQISTLTAREREAKIEQAKNAGVWGFLAGLIPAVLQYLSTH